MYSGVDKGGGGVVGTTATAAPTAAVRAGDAVEAASAEEVVFVAAGEDGDGAAALVAGLDPARGGLVWGAVRAEEGIAALKRRAVQQSMMQSMLLDSARCDKFERAIRRVLHAWRDAREPEADGPTVLDIGTGTGLLAMFAVRHGARHVYAVEMFDAMAEIARQVVAQNGMEDRITVLTRKSTDLRVPEDIPDRCDVLVTETLDSCLLGEATLTSVRHAHARLLKPNAPTVPHCATVYAALAAGQDGQHESGCSGCFPSPRAWIDADISDPTTGTTSMRNAMARDCRYSVAVPLHADFRLPGASAETAEAAAASASASPSDVTPDEPAAREGRWNDAHTDGAYPVRLLTEFAPVMHFTFAGNEETADGEEQEVTQTASYETQLTITADCPDRTLVEAVAMFWEVALTDPNDEDNGDDGCIVYSTYPGVEANWQPHWQQVLFPLPAAASCAVHVCSGDTCKLISAHDLSTVWFLVRESPALPLQHEQQVQAPCTEAEAEADAAADTGQPLKKRARPSAASAPASLSAPSTSSVLCRQASTGYRGEFSPQLVHTRNKRGIKRVHGREPCGCGWHLLCNLDRVTAMADPERSRSVQQALSLVAQQLLHQCDFGSGRADVQMALDASDTGWFALQLAGHLRRAGGHHSVRAATVQSKFMAYFLLSQVARSNDFDNDLLLVQNAQDEAEATGESKAAAEAAVEKIERDGDDRNEEGGSECPWCPTALVTEPFWFQLNESPIKTAVNLLHVRKQLQQDPGTGAEPVVCPLRACIRAVPVRLSSLHAASHHAVGTVSGFDHSAFATAMQGWEAHDFVYRMGNFEHTFVGPPQTAIELDMTQTRFESTTKQVRLPLSPTAAEQGDRAAACVPHCVIFFVDYLLATAAAPTSDTDGDVWLRGWERSHGFPWWERQLVRFLPASVRGEDCGAPDAVLLTSRYDADAATLSFDISFA